MYGVQSIHVACIHTCRVACIEGTAYIVQSILQSKHVACMGSRAYISCIEGGQPGQMPVSATGDAGPGRAYSHRRPCVAEDIGSICVYRVHVCRGRSGPACCLCSNLGCNYIGCNASRHLDLWPPAALTVDNGWVRYRPGTCCSGCRSSVLPAPLPRPEPPRRVETSRDGGLAMRHHPPRTQAAAPSPQACAYDML